MKKGGVRDKKVIIQISRRAYHNIAAFLSAELREKARFRYGVRS